MGTQTLNARLQADELDTVRRVVGPELKRLSIRQELVVHVGALHRLTELEIGYVDGEQDLQPLQQLPALHALRVSAGTDTKLLGIPHLTQLRDLRLRDCFPEESALPPGLTHLGLLNLYEYHHCVGRDIPGMLRSYPGSLASLAVNLERFGSDPAQLLGIPCLRELRHLHLQFPSCQHQVWQPSIPGLQTLKLELLSLDCKPRWSLDQQPVEQLSVVWQIVWHGGGCWDMRGVEGVRAQRFHLIFAVHPETPFPCYMSCGTWQIGQAEIGLLGDPPFEFSLAQPVLPYVAEAAGPLLLSCGYPPVHIGGRLFRSSLVE